MGKKSKRREATRNQTKKQTGSRGISKTNTKDEFEQIERATSALFDEAIALVGKLLTAQAHEKLLKIVSLLEANKDMLMKNHLDYYIITNVHAYEKIAHLEVRRRNFQAVIHIHDFCDSIAIMTDQLYLLYCLALMVTGKKDSYQASEAALKYAQHTFSVQESDPSQHNLHSRKAHLARLGSYWNYFLVELRRMRKWDEALDFTNKFGIYIEECKLLSSDFLYITTYIERYRVEARKRPRNERNWMSVSLYKYISAQVIDSVKKVSDVRAVRAHPYVKLIFAQWVYLNHQGTTEQPIDTAIILVETYIRAQYESTVMHLCLGCEQQSTPSNPFLVCSGCRVACFCCIDHQRSSWKKELHLGVGIGHKILCPLYKAYHKCNNAGKSHGKNIDEYYSRFRKECEKFLSDGLGLRDLCFSRDFVDKNSE